MLVSYGYRPTRGRPGLRATPARGKLESGTEGNAGREREHATLKRETKRNALVEQIVGLGTAAFRAVNQRTRNDTPHTRRVSGDAFAVCVGFRRRTDKSSRFRDHARDAVSGNVKQRRACRPK